MRWTVKVEKPRKGDGRNLYLRAWGQTVNGHRPETRASTGTTDPAEAEELRRAFERDLNALAGGERETLADILKLRIYEFEEDPHISRSTVAGARAVLNKLKASLETIRIEALSRSHVLGLERQLLETLKPPTVKNYLAVLAAAWNWARAEGMVEGSWPKLPKRRAREKRSGSKRPYRDDEVVAVLAWLKGYNGGRWHAAAALLADTGRRVGEIMPLMGCDVDREAGTITIRPNKNARTEKKTIPVLPDVLAELPEAGPDEYVFASRGRGGWGRRNPKKHLKGNGLGRAIKKAVKALGIADGERLDTHSLRRAFVTSADRAGVSADLGRRVTGHRTAQMWEHYMSNAVGDDLREVVSKVRARREKSSHDSSHKSGPPSPGDDQQAVEPQGFADDEALSTVLLRRDSHQGMSPDARRDEAPSVCAENGSKREHSGARRINIWGRLDRDIATLARWADEDPRAMLKLLTDSDLRSQLLDALTSFGPEARKDKAEEAS